MPKASCREPFSPKEHKDARARLDGGTGAARPVNAPEVSLPRHAVREVGSESRALNHDDVKLAENGQQVIAPPGLNQAGGVVCGNSPRPSTSSHTMYQRPGRRPGSSCYIAVKSRYGMNVGRPLLNLNQNGPNPGKPGYTQVPDIPMSRYTRVSGTRVPAICRSKERNPGTPWTRVYLRTVCHMDPGICECQEYPGPGYARD